MPASYWITATVTALVVVICVVLHFEMLRFLSLRLRVPAKGHRPRVVILILCLLLLHITEIWIFGGAYCALLSFTDNGTLSGHEIPGLLDCVYYSATVFTTLGFGDLVPTGPIRFMTGTEAISGLTFITWSASYTYLYMEKSWRFGRD